MAADPTAADVRAVMDARARVMDTVHQVIADPTLTTYEQMLDAVEGRIRVIRDPQLAPAR